MKLSVIVPCFNAANTITVQLEALASQCWSKPWEIIISNNGSTDETLDIVERYQKWIPNLRIVDSADRQGAAHARNVGVSAAAGEILLFCDADDEVGPGWVAAMGEALAKHDFVAGRLEATKLNEPWVLKARPCPQQDGLQAYKYPPYLPHAASCNLGIKRSLHEAVGGFDESIRILNDTDYCWRLQLMGIQCHFVPEALVHYRFRHTLFDIYRQQHSYGKDNVLLYKKYQSLGMPKLSRMEGIKAWGYLLRRLPQLRRREKRIRWINRFAWRMGRLQGSIQYRVFGL